MDSNNSNSNANGHRTDSQIYQNATVLFFYNDRRQRDCWCSKRLIFTLLMAAIITVEELILSFFSAYPDHKLWIFTNGFFIAVLICFPIITAIICYLNYNRWFSEPQPPSV